MKIIASKLIRALACVGASQALLQESKSQTAMITMTACDAFGQSSISCLLFRGRDKGFLFMDCTVIVSLVQLPGRLCISLAAIHYLSPL